MKVRRGPAPAERPRRRAGRGAGAELTQQTVARPLIHHQLEVHGAAPLVAVVVDVLCPRLALDVDQHPG